jgi:hypothetical protein
MLTDRLRRKPGPLENGSAENVFGVREAMLKFAPVGDGLCQRSFAARRSTRAGVSPN